MNEAALIKLAVVLLCLVIYVCIYRLVGSYLGDD
jgi:hypothetical protein